MKSKLFSIAAMTAALALSSCGTTQIAYFQDMESQQVLSSAAPKNIVLRPEDKLCILVTCRNIEMTTMFNLPYVSQRIGMTADSYTSTNQAVSCYTIDEHGDIDFPIAGKIHIAGLTRPQVADKIKSVLEEKQLVIDPVVTVEYANLTVSLMGEVTKPGRYSINRDYLTILDAISMAGDLTIFGLREKVKLIRKNENGQEEVYIVNLCSASELVKSPAYFIQQGDIIYVEPNSMRARQSTVNGNTVLSASFWISIASLASSIISTVVVIGRK